MGVIAAIVGFLMAFFPAHYIRLLTWQQRGQPQLPFLETWKDLNSKDNRSQLKLGGIALLGGGLFFMVLAGQ